MRKILSILLMLMSFNAFTQVSADPGLLPIVIRSISNETINQFQLPLNGIVTLKVPIQNLSLTNGIPAGTCKIKITLGTKLILAPSFNLLAVNTSAYFSWTSVVSNGLVEITGDLVAQLPSNFSDTATFNVMGSLLNNSTIITNFLITNHNTAVTLSDDNANNNTSSLAYRIISTVLPVTFTNIEATKIDCSIKLDMNIANEINVKNYEIELSNDFNNFEKVVSFDANTLNAYTHQFFIPEKYQKPLVLLRVKVVDFDGKVQYSEIKKISGICANSNSISVYPNPIPNHIDYIDIENFKSVFNGDYTFVLFEISSGKLISYNNIKLNNINKYRYNLKTIPTGQYILKMFKNNQNDTNIFKIIKR